MTNVACPSREPFDHNETQSGKRSPELIDYEDARLRTPILNMIIIIVVGTVVGLIVIFALGALLSPFWVVGILATIVGGGLIIFQLSSERSAMRHLRQSARSPVRELLPQLVPGHTLAPHVTFGKVVITLVAQHRQGTTVRIWRKKEPPRVEPLAQLFEPVPVDESVSLFVGLEHEPSREDADEKLSSSERDRRETARKLKRNVALGGGVSAVCVFGFLSAISTLEMWQQRRFHPMSLMWYAWLVVAIFGIGGRGAWSWKQQWMLVPGGIVSRRSRMFRSATELHLFRRTDSVLIAQAGHQKLWTVHVADAAESQMARMTPREAHLLLRAWLSPIPPPPIERLSDLQ